MVVVLEEPIHLPYWSISELEQFLLHILTIFVIIILGYGIYTLRNLLKNKEEYRLDVRRFLIYGIFQKKVNFKKEFGSIIHILLSFSIGILMIGTLLVAIHDHIFPLLRGSSFLAFEVIMDIAGLFLLVSVCLALLRRIIVKPDYLPTEFEDVVILILLLCVAVTGFMLEGIRLMMLATEWSRWSTIGYTFTSFFKQLPLDTGVWKLLHRFLWWFHALLAFTLIVSVPYTKLSHPLLGTFGMLIKKRVFPSLSIPFNLREVIASGNFDVKMGIEKVADLRLEQKIDAASCTNCGRCQRVCPAIPAGRETNPRAFIQKIKKRLHADSSLPYEKQPSLLSSLSENEVWGCTTCAACVEECPMLIDHINLLIDIRRYILSVGKVDQKKFQLINNLSLYGNPYGFSRKEKPIAFLYKETPEYLLWVGCLASYDKRCQKVIEAFITLLKKAKINFFTLGEEEICCGDPLRRLGEESRFQEIVFRNAELFERYHVKKVITICPHCYNVFKNEYSKLGIPLDVIHHTEFISKILIGCIDHATPLKPDMKVTLHDSCYLARYNNIIKEPRKILNYLKIRSVEMSRNKKRTFCCGGGGANYWYDVPEQIRISRLRLRQAVMAGADMIITECPFCLTMLGDAIKVEGFDNKIQVLDISELICSFFLNSTNSKFS